MEYTKKEILASRRFEKWREWLKVNLPDDGTYTFEQVEDFMSPLFEETNSGVKNADGSLTVEVDSTASEAEVLKLGVKGKTAATVRVNDQGSLFHSGHLGLGSLEVNGAMTKGGEVVATEKYVDTTKTYSNSNLKNARGMDFHVLDISDNDTPIELGAYKYIRLMIQFNADNLSIPEFCDPGSTRPNSSVQMPVGAEDHFNSGDMIYVDICRIIPNIIHVTWDGMTYRA